MNSGCVRVQVCLCRIRFGRKAMQVTELDVLFNSCRAICRASKAKAVLVLGLEENTRTSETCNQTKVKELGMGFAND